MTVRRIMTALVTAAIGCACAAAGATAGTYEVLACGAAPGAVNNSWTATNSSSTSLVTGTACPAASGQPAEPIGRPGTVEQGLYAADVLGAGADTADGATAGFTFAAPTGTTITRLRARFYGGRRVDWQTRLLADGATIHTCTVLGSFCAIGSPYAPEEPEGERDYPSLNAQTVRFEVGCDVPDLGEECGGGSSLHEGWISLQAARVTLDDPMPPTIDLSAEPPTGWVRGELLVPTSAADAGGGVRTVSALVDGEPTDTVTSECDPTTPRACPATAAPALRVPTGALPDGDHEVSVTALDVGGESATLTRAIRTDNSAPAAPALAAIPAAGTWHATRNFAIVATLPAGQASPIENLHWRLCSPTGGCDGATSQSAGEPVPVVVPADGPHRVEVWLEDEAGNVDSSDRAELVLRSDTKPPTPVAELRAVGGPDTWNVAWTRPSPGVSPESSLVTFCDPAKRCRTDDVGEAQATAVNTDQAGVWTVSVRMRDDTGAEGPSTTLGLEVPAIVAGPTAPTPPSPLPPVAVPTAGALQTPKLDPQLRLTSARVQGGTLEIHGRLRPEASALLPKVTVRWEVRSRVIVRRVKVRATRDGRFIGMLRLGPRLRASKNAVVTASLPVRPRFTAARASRRLTHR